MTKETLLGKLTREVERKGSQYRAAESLGVSSQYFNDILTGKREPGGKLLTAMGLERVVTYRSVVK